MHDYLQQTDDGLTLIRKHLIKATGLIRSFKRLAIDRSLDEPISFSLQACTSDLLTSLHSQLKQRPVTLYSSLPDCELFSHPGILSQVLQNLIDNALQHAFNAKDSGHIWLEGRLLDHNRLELVIRDDGNGIDERLQHTLFDPFVTSGRSHGHTGLGLHLVHQWVTQVLQGHIHMDSAVGQGTGFTLNLPLDIRDRRTSP
jgi:signal transduction histidine kinase